MTRFLSTFWSLFAFITSCGDKRPAETAVVRPAPTAKAGSWTKPAPDEIKERLTPLQYSVTQEEDTERPFSNEYWDNHEAGVYVDVVTGEPLFSSTDKYDSGTGWPSFTQPIEAGRVTSRVDERLVIERNEVRSAIGDSHLGHVFDDGPEPTGLRYCINSASLRFVPVDNLEAEGYGAYLAKFGRAPATETAYLAGGCFWGMEEILRDVPGVVDTEVGYMAGAEAVRVTFDPGRLSYEKLLEDSYFRMHDPTKANRQGNDVGEQYRSAIFYTSDAQKQTAAAVKARVDKSGHWKQPVVTELSKAGDFTVADEHHQDYLEKHPDGYTCHFLRDWDL